MIIYIVGMSCVGKSTVGRMLAEKLGFTFFDLDQEVEKYYQKPIERIQDETFTMNEFRRKASIVLDVLFAKNIDSVIAGTPAGLKFAYLGVYKKYKMSSDLYSIHLLDTCENVLERLTFFDKDSKPDLRPMSDRERAWQLKELRADYAYFKSSLNRADLEINIENIQLEDIPEMIITALNAYKENTQTDETVLTS